MCEIEIKKTPLLRFRAYNEEWKCHRLGEISNRITRKNINLESTLALTISAQHGLIDQNDFFSKQIASRDISGYYLIENGEFAYNKSYSKDYPWGAVKRLDKYAKGVLSTLYIVFESKNVSSNYLVAYYDSFKWHREVSVRAAEGARNHGLLNIAAQDFFETQILVPTNEDEQKKIGILFEQIDNIIRLYQHELELLQLEKQTLMSKMFPQEGESVPDIRFKGFTDDWKQSKWSDTFITLPSNSLSRADLNTEFGIVKNIHYGDVLIKYGEVIDVTKEKIPYISNQEFQCSTAVLLQNGDVIMADAAEDETVGKCSEIAGLSNQKIVSGLHTIPCRPNESFSRGYLGYYMNSRAYHNQLLPLIQGSKISSISKSALKDTSIICPELEEQKQIGIFFSNLDKLITLHQRKLEEINIIKKTLLKYMFV